MKNLLMSAAIGDIAGSAYEGRSRRTKDYDAVKMFSSRARFTDDTVLTFACAEAFLHGLDMASNLWMCGNQHIDAGFGSRFRLWIGDHYHLPYRSFGNGSAMRVSPAAWLAKDMAETLHLARLTAEVTHDHPEGIKGAQATASAIFLARTGHDKAEIKAYVEREFGYDLSRTCDEIRPTYHHVESCQETVPQAITAFLESRDFEDALRTAVSLGGDSDTLAAITGSIAEAFYGVPEELRQECRKRLPPELAEILREWESALYNEKICGRI